MRDPPTKFLVPGSRPPVNKTSLEFQKKALDLDKILDTSRLEFLI